MEEKNLEFTGERLVTGIFEYWSLEHLHRYAISLPFIGQKSVVDIASGEGYGSNILSAHASKVTGIDISPQAVAHANSKYKKSNLEFIVGSAFDIPMPDKSVDVLISFETIEHHAEHELMMQEIRRVLKEDGMVIISSPDKRTYSDIPGYKNPYHVKELYTAEFEALIRKYFANAFILNQKTIFGSVISSTTEPVSGGVTEFFGNYSAVQAVDEVIEPLYNIAFASQAKLPIERINLISTFASRQVFETSMALSQENNRLSNENKTLRRDILRLKGSRAFRLGGLLIAPFSKVRNMLRKRK
jgi:ubiquinone/menaquinone biosynthesis C-methylase UbiE